MNTSHLSHTCAQPQRLRGPQLASLCFLRSPVGDTPIRTPSFFLALDVASANCGRLGESARMVAVARNPQSRLGPRAHELFYQRHLSKTERPLLHAGALGTFTIIAVSSSFFSQCPALCGLDMRGLDASTTENGSGSVMAMQQVTTPTVTPVRITPLAASPPSLASSAKTVANDSDSGVGRDRSALVNATEVTAILSKIGPTTCSGDTKAIISAIFSANSVLLDTCLKESGYMLFPYAGYFPRQGQTSKVCASPSCMDLLSGIVLAKVPNCEYDKYNPRSLAEAFFQVRVDLANQRSPPSTDEFTELYNLNKALNILKENVTLQATVKTSFSIEEVARSMNPAEINPDVVLGENYVIYVQASSSSNATEEDNSSKSQASKSNSNLSGSKNTSSDAGTVGPNLSTDGAVTGASTQTSSGKLSVSYFFIGFAWIVFNGSYFMLMSQKD